MGIALIDSVHFEIIEKNGESKSKIVSQKSLFDYFWDPLGTKDEKTYSAPFATHMFVKSRVTDKEGNERRDYAPLKYAGLWAEVKATLSHLIWPLGSSRDLLLAFFFSFLFWKWSF